MDPSPSSSTQWLVCSCGVQCLLLASLKPSNLLIHSATFIYNFLTFPQHTKWIKAMKDDIPWTCSRITPRPSQIFLNEGRWLITSEVFIFKLILMVNLQSMCGCQGLYPNAWHRLWW
jgi:hypothetical protein